MGTAIQDAINNYNPQSLFVEELAYAPTFEISSNPTVSLDEIKARRFYIVDDGEFVSETAYLFDNMENRFNLMDFS